MYYGDSQDEMCHHTILWLMEKAHPYLIILHDSQVCPVVRLQQNEKGPDCLFQMLAQAGLCLDSDAMNKMATAEDK